MAKSKSKIPLLNTGRDLARVGDYVRWTRATAEMTRREFGAAILARDGAVGRWERHERRPTAEAIERILSNIPESRDVADPLIAMATATPPLAAQTGRPVVTDDDRDHLENLRGPAALLEYPYVDVMAVNREWANSLPGLAPGESDDAETSNLIEYLLHDSTHLVENRLDLVHGMLFGLRMMRPLTEPDRFSALVEKCVHAPDFDRLWRTDPAQGVLRDASFLIWNPHEARGIRYRVHRSHRSRLLPGPRMVVYSLYRSRARRGSLGGRGRRQHGCLTQTPRAENSRNPPGLGDLPR